ncbi:DUF222 domain-containing protein [Sciscionella sediminilitoris]|uniref:DUF222 domain-containing protein n=1 Tax=Sciscionella sediminilitoris TaxID=1445613 RepID=UPI0031B5F360
MSTGEIETLLSSRERLDRFIEQAAVVRRAEAEMLHQLAELDKEGAPVEFGYCGSAATLAQDVLRISRAEARRMAERARVLFGALGISGEPLSPDLPSTAEAYSRGAVGSEHVDRIRQFAAELPAEVLIGTVLAKDPWPIAENALAQIAGEVGPRGLVRPIRELQARLDPDGRPPTDRDPVRPDREIWLRQHANQWDIHGHLDYETGLKLRSLLDALGKPRSSEANGGTPDTRTPTERDADAFADIVQVAANPENLPENGVNPSPSWSP